MSQKFKKSSFSYLSMCSCCNVVSKYSVNVKKHLQQQHSGEKWRKEKKLVIPVRISSRYEKCIHRSLDKDSKRPIKNLVCPQTTIHSTPNVKEHAKKKHVDNNMGSLQSDTGRSSRKRKPPKWLEDSNFNLKMSKKVKLDEQRKEVGRQSLSSEITNKTGTSTTSNTSNQANMDMQVEFQSKENSKRNLKTTQKTPKVGRNAQKQENLPKIDKNAFDKNLETSLPLSDNKHSHKSQTDSQCTQVKVALIRLPSEEQHTHVSDTNRNRIDELTVVHKSEPDKIGKVVQSFENKTEEKSVILTNISNTLEENESSKESALITKMNMELRKDDKDNYGEFFEDDADLHDSDDDYNPDEEDTDHDLDLEMEPAAKKNNKKTYACHKCDKSYELLNSLNRHIQKVHMDQEKAVDLIKQNKNRKVETKLAKSSQPLKNANFVKIGDDQIMVTKYKCPFCPFYLYHREYIISHVQQSHAEAKNFTTHDIVIEKVVIEKDFDREFFKCHKCSHEEKWKKDMLNHMTSCIKRKNRSLGLPCLLPESYTMKRLLTADLVCPVCKDVKKGKDELEKHMKQDHVQEKTCHVQLRSSLPEPQPMPKKCTDHFCFICPSCHFSTRRKDMLRDHLRSHKNHNMDMKLPLIKCILLSEDASEISKSNKSSDFSVINRSKQDHISEAMTKATSIEKKSKDGIGDQQVNRINNDIMETIDRNEIQSYSTLSETKLKEGTYICPLCENFSTMSKENSVQHMLNYHPDKTIEYDIHYILPDIVLKEDKSNQTRGKMMCITCGLNDTYLWNLVKHINLTKGHKGYTGKSKIKGLRPPFMRSEKSASTSVSPEKEEQPCGQLFEILVTPSTGLEYINEREGVVGQYSCEECVDVCTYSTKKSLLKHLKQRHDDKCLLDTYACVFQMRDIIAGGADKTYLCSVCQEKAGTKGKLVEHFRAKHQGKLSELIEMIKNPKSQLECEVCHKELDTRENLQRHLLMHVNQWQPHCPCCVLSFDTQQDADHHAAVYHADECKICYVCAKTFINDRSYQTHMKQHENTGNGNDTPETPDSSKCLCQHCGTSVGISSYKRHVLRFHWQHVACECDICISQKVRLNKSSLKCDVCSRILCSRYALDAHCWKHHPERYKRSFKTCQTCKRPMHGFDTEILCACKPEDKIAYSPKFRRPSRHQRAGSHEIREPANIYNRNVIVEDCSAEAIKQNIMKVDLNSSCPYSCSVCKFSTRTKKELYRHVRRRHMRDDQKPFSCSVCKLGFCHMTELRRHSRSHVAAKPFQCHICKHRFFKNKNHLKEHMYTHGTYLRFTCGYCDRKFAQNGPLYCHASCHDKQKPFKCMFCDAGFSSSTDLLRHMDKYSSESVKEKLQCTYCKEQFPNMNYLSKHILLHFPQDPFSCSVCSQTFTTFRKMYSHKTNLQHFTKEEREQAKKDVVAPGRRFKKTISHKPLEETETTEAVSSLGEEVPVNQDVDRTSSHDSETALYEGSEIVEIEICEDMANTINTKEGLALFEDQVLRGMLEINPNTRQILGQSKGGTIAELSTLVGKGHTVKAEVEEYQVESPDVSYIINAAEASTSSGVADVNDGKAELIASILAHNEPGKTQIYQMPDGSLIHVIVQKDST